MGVLDPPVESVVVVPVDVVVVVPVVPPVPVGVGDGDGVGVGVGGGGGGGAQPGAVPSDMVTQINDDDMFHSTELIILDTL